MQPLTAELFHSVHLIQCIVKVWSKSFQDLLKQRKIKLTKKSPTFRIQEIPEYVRNFYSLIAVSVEAQHKVLMHRDFQSQNIMVKPNSEIAFVDFQGARRGAMFYDLASLLWDPYVELSLTEIKDFFEYWRVSYRETKTYTKDDAWEAFIHASLQRVMQAMGAYCFLSKVKGIQKFATHWYKCNRYT